MTRGSAAVIVASWLAVSVLTGCGYDYLLVSDPLFETVFDVEAMMAATDSSLRRAPPLGTQEDWGSRIDSVLAADAPRAGVILTPLLYNEAPSLADRYPNLPFLLLSTTEERRPNLLSVRFERIAAFREAGRAAESHLQETGVSVALFAEAANDEAMREIEAFDEALSSGTIDSRFVYSRPPDRETIRQDVLSLGDGDYLWAIFLRGNTPFALDLVSSRGGSAIAEDLGPGEGYRQLVIGSVERDYFGALRRGIDAVEGQQGEELVLVASALFVTRSPGANEGQVSSE